MESRRSRLLMQPLLAASSCRAMTCSAYFCCPTHWLGLGCTGRSLIGSSCCSTSIESLQFPQYLERRQTQGNFRKARMAPYCWRQRKSLRLACSEGSFRSKAGMPALSNLPLLIHKRSFRTEIMSTVVVVIARSSL